MRLCVPRLILAVAVAAGVVACSKTNQFEEQPLKSIADLQDRRKTDSLVLYLSHDEASIRQAAALALGSVQDTSAVNSLASLLDGEKEKDESVSVNAAFSIGQTGGKRAVSSLRPGLKSTSAEIRREVYEAIGKVVLRKDIDVLAERPGDTTSLIGYAWALYRAGIRGVSDSLTIANAVLIMNDANSGRSARLGIAHFFARGSYTMKPGIAEAILKAAQDKDAEIRMAAVSALVKVKEEEAIEAVKKPTADADYRVRVNSARALRSQPWAVSKPLYAKLVSDSNASVSIAAAEIMINVASATDTSSIALWAREAREWRTQATLYQCLQRLSRGDGARDEIKSLYNNSANPYQKAALISALSEDVANYKFIFDQYKAAEEKVIKSTASDAIATINTRYKDMKPEVREEFASMYRQMVTDGDLGAIIAACGALGDSTLGFKSIISDYSFLEQAKSRLSLPRDFETYVPLERTLNYFKGLPPPAPLKNEYNHPIDWNLVETITADQHVSIETTQGEIVMRLLVDEAPGSVANFVSLVESNYFNGKVFHRVVPNFVVQTGCNRGDGLGSEDYSIRSEFSRRKYKTGSVGMASAGKDTEGTQWFITHSPTPHLDGRYTIFAEVVSGMDVVHKIQVGDQIISARLIGY